MTSSLNSRTFTLLSYLLLAAMLAGAAWLVVGGRLMAAGGIAALVVLAIGFIAAKDRLPSIFTLLFLLAGLVNVAAYIFGLWHSIGWFDEAVHFYTSFTIVAAIGWLLLARSSLNAAGSSVMFSFALTGIGLLLGILWEIFEWIIGIIGSPADTIVDLVMDVLGAVAAGLFCAWVANQERRSSAHRAAGAAD